jgi:two-component system, OmpR family, phosphate regulon sensor histidine kinase PhoR
VKARELVVRSGIIGSSLGFVILESDRVGGFTLAAFSESARTLLGVGASWQSNSSVDLADFPAELAQHITSAGRALQMQWSGSILRSDGTTIEAHIGRVADVAGGFVVTVELEDVTARVRSEQALANALANERATVQELERLHEQQESFVSAVTHELRNPLTSIRGFTDELVDLELPEPAPYYVGIVSRNARRLATLVDNLLEAARIGSGADRGEREECDIDRLLIECAEDLAPLAESQQVTVVAETSRAGSITVVRSDVERILTNLVSNAIKFSPVGGEVRLSAERSDTSAIIRVRDSGPGVAVDELERVFERFYRSPSAKAVSGTGLGLAITRGLAETQGGTVYLESDGMTGTTAVLELPLGD